MDFIQVLSTIFQNEDYEKTNYDCEVNRVVKNDNRRRDNFSQLQRYFLVQQISFRITFRVLYERKFLVCLTFSGNYIKSMVDINVNSFLLQVQVFEIILN